MGPLLGPPGVSQGGLLGGFLSTSKCVVPQGMKLSPSYYKYIFCAISFTDCHGQGNEEGITAG